MGDGDKTPLRLQFNPKIQLEFRGTAITSDAGLLAIRELDDALGVSRIAADYLQESRTGRNIRHHLPSPGGMVEMRLGVYLSDPERDARWGSLFKRRLKGTGDMGPSRSKWSPSAPVLTMRL